MSEKSFEDEVRHVIEVYENAIGHTATRTWQLITKYGEIEALSRLVVSPDLQKGFKVLRDRGQLDHTFEAVVVRFQHLFKSNVVQAAKWRLNNANALL